MRDTTDQGSGVSVPTGSGRPTRETDTVIIGAGQAGLSLGRYLSIAGQRHAVLDRGRIGERWLSERWDSLALLTPNWLNRLDGGAAHAEPDGFLGRDAFVDYLRDYARSSRVAVHEHVTVLGVERARGGFHVQTDSGAWRARNVVVAAGDSTEPRIPEAAAAAPPRLSQLHASRYRNPSLLPEGGVLVVGPGPSGQQIAAELRRAGRDVVLAVGRHARVPRRYRGRDIWHWLKELGQLDQTIDEVPVAARQTPSLALTGGRGGEQLDLDVLQRLGVVLAGRLEGLEWGNARFGDTLQEDVEDADRRMRRLLDRIDGHIDGTFAGRWPHDPDPIPAVRISSPPVILDLVERRISTVIWATGYRSARAWLHVPVFDARGEIAHRRGITGVPGLYVLGLKFQHRRVSHMIGGVGPDAAFLAQRIAAKPDSQHSGCDGSGQVRRRGPHGAPAAHTR